MPVHQLQFFLNPWILAFILNGWLEGSKDQQCMMHIALALIWFSDWSDWFLVGDCRVASSHCFSWGWRRTASKTPSTDQQGKTFSPALPPTLGTPPIPTISTTECNFFSLFLLFLQGGALNSVEPAARRNLYSLTTSSNYHSCCFATLYPSHRPISQPPNCNVSSRLKTCFRRVFPFRFAEI